MSRIGNAPITLPKGVQAQVGEGTLRFKGPKGELNCPVPDGISCLLEGEIL